MSNDYLGRKYGLVVHYVYGNAYPVTRNKDGTIPASLDDVADRFDVESFARDLEPIKGTCPSPSFVTQQGTKISTLSWGRCGHAICG